VDVISIKHRENEISHSIARMKKESPRRNILRLIHDQERRSDGIVRINDEFVIVQASSLLS